MDRRLSLHVVHTHDAYRTDDADVHPIYACKPFKIV